MALQTGRSGRHRSSTSASRGLNRDEEGSEIVSLLQDFSSPLRGGDNEDDNEAGGELSQTSDAAARIVSILHDEPAARDTFRHGAGFESILEYVDELSNGEVGIDNGASRVELLSGCSSVLAEALKDHQGNQKYFASHVQGWSKLQSMIETLQDSIVAQAAIQEASTHVQKLHDSILELCIGDGCSSGQAVASNGEENDASDAPNLTNGNRRSIEGAHFRNPHAGAALISLALRLLSGGKSDGVDLSQSVAMGTLRSLTTGIHARLQNQISLRQSNALHEVLISYFSMEGQSELKSTLHDLVLSLAAFGLGTLDDVSSVFEKARTSTDAQDLLLAVLRRSKQPPFIQFDLAQHGYASIELPSLPRLFPSGTGYTLTAWIRVDEYDSDSHTTLFGAFDAAQTCFVLLYLEKDSHQLILQTSVRSSRPSVRFKLTKIVASRWYHLAIVHRRSASDPRQSPAVLFVNGEFTEQVKCSYPEVPPEMEASPAGPSMPRRTKPVQAFFGTPHDLALHVGPDEVHSRWSLASAHLYSSPLTDEFIAVHHRLGSRYSGNLQDCLGPLLTYQASAELNRYNELLHPDKSDKSDIVTSTEGRGSEVVPEARLLISISPTAIVALDGSTDMQTPKHELDRKASQRYKQLMQKTRAIAINAAIPTINEAISRSYGTGIMTGDPVIAVPKALDDASWCLAGSLSVLMRLLECANTKTSFLKAVQIFFECVKDSWRISEAMEKGNGFGLFAMVVREKLGFETGATASTASRKPSAMLGLEDRQTLPIELLQTILDFVGYNHSKPEDSMIVNPMGYRVLLIDFDTWRRCDANTQQVYYEQFVHMVSHNKHQAFNQKRLTRMRVVKKLIEALKAEEIVEEVVPSLMKALKALLDTNGAHALYKDLAMFVAFGLQDERAMVIKPMRTMASIVNFKTRTASWARQARGSRPSTPGGAPTPGSLQGISRSELAIHVLQLLTDIMCDDRTMATTRRFNRAVPNRWLLHLLAETDVRVINLTLQIISRSLAVLGAEFKAPFVDKNGGFVTLKSRLKMFWRSTATWQLCFAMMFGLELTAPDSTFSLFGLIEALQVNDNLEVMHPEMLSPIMAMLETGLRSVVREEAPSESDVHILQTVIQFLSEAYNRSIRFRDFATGSRYVQELLFVLFPVLVGSDRLSAETELQAKKDSLSFKGEEVRLRPHSNSTGERPPSVRSLTMEDDKSAQSTRAPKRVEGPRRLSSFILVTPEPGQQSSSHAHFTTALAPKSAEPIKLNAGNALVESLLEVGVSLFIDLICNKKEFMGIGLFLKVPPGFREHQAYFESYVLVNTISQLWNHLKLNQDLFLRPNVLTNLSRYSQHMAEALFEGWFIDGAQPVLEFTGQVLEYLQQPDIASDKSVRLCAQFVSGIRVVFLRVTLWRLSELNEALNEGEAVAFINKMNYWQTILFSSENQETLFIRLICFLLYTKLVSESRPVRLAAARLWRTILMQKPTESATLLTYAIGSEQRHLSTGFMKLVSMDDDEFIEWVDENRSSLDTLFLGALNKPWDEFVSEENKRNEETAKGRLSKRRERLRQWQMEDASADDFLHRYEVSTGHWRSNVHSQERVRLQRAIQDHQENVAHLNTVFARMNKIVKQPCGLEAIAGDQKWQLDETEAVNRMRMRTLPYTTEGKDTIQPRRKMSERQPLGGLAINTQVSRITSDNIMSSIPGSPIVFDTDGVQESPDANLRPRSDSVSNSQLLEGGFEMVDDPKEGEDGIVEDKNRKIMTSLQRGDMVQQLYNISRIVGLEACEGLLTIGKKCLYLQDNFFQRSDGEIVSASQAPEDERDPYVQLISGKDVGSQRTSNSLGDQETRHWDWSEVLSISKRRFLFRDVSVEVFFTDGRSYLLTCMASKTRDDLYSAIVNRAPHVHSSAAVASEDAWRLDTLRNPEEGPQSLGTRFASVFNSTPTHAATKKWVKGEMSNFQYLMLVNTMAGRTFNDLTQYPVFPWVLADYTSEELDLNDPKTFRNFSKPMGCQTPTREAEYRDRFQQFAEMGDQNAPPFHYGTHYSSAMIVTSYLIRLQPFVQSYLLLQGGSFDHADRLFDSIGRAWLSASRDTMSDVRELTPEFFYLPEFLMNVNKYDFGAKQGDGGLVNDVTLPPWAKGDPHLFIMKHREALESPYVTENLHHWIDLIFGYKQRGEFAIEATNVFQHLSYHGAKNLDTISDPVERLATIGIIHSFGQTPHQVFPRQHPARELARSAISRLDTSAPSLTRLPDPLFESDEKVACLTFSPTHERLLCSGPCKLNLMPNCDRFLQWDFADHSVRFFSSNTKRLLGLYENTHIGPVSTAVFADSKTLVTAGVDCTIAIWAISTSRDLIDMQPKTYLFGHRTAVTVLAASRVFSTLLSASADGQVILWGLNKLNCIRVLLPAGGTTIQAAKVSNVTGHILLCQGPNVMLYTLNGHLLVNQRVCDTKDDEVTCCAFYEGAGNEWLERELIFTGHHHGIANVWALTTLGDGAWHLQLIKRLNHVDASREDGGNTSAAITALLPMPQAVYTGDEQGKVWEWDCIQRHQSSVSVRSR